MEKHKRFLILSFDDNYVIVGEFDNPEEIQKFILDSSYRLQDLLIVENLPLTIQIGYYHEDC